MLRTAGIEARLERAEERVMPESSNNNSGQSLPPNSSLENLRKQAKSLLKAARANDEKALDKFRAFRLASDPPARVNLSNAQLVIARSYGFTSWPKLKHFVAAESYSALPDVFRAGDKSDKLVDRFISLSCLNYTNDHHKRQDHARELFSANSSLSKENIYAATTVGDVQVVRQMLQDSPSLAKVAGGPYKWEPILYASYSRLNSTNTGHSTLEATRVLLEFGADPNAGFLWDRNYLFTALTGVFGEGESGPLHQPEHQYCYQLARLLLEAGADPNDSQTLYNRMFTGGTAHLALLFEFGLGEYKSGIWFKRLGDLQESPWDMLQEQMAWAAKYNQRDRMQLLIAHGVDVNGVDTRLRRTPYELAIMNGNNEIAALLVEHGARTTSLSDIDAFVAACLNSDRLKAKALLDNDPTLVARLGVDWAELMNRAAEENRQESVRFMVELGFDVNARKRTAPLHLAAAGGHLEMVKLLIELGADPSIRDEEFNATPLGWAEYGERKEVAEFLKSIE